MKKDLKISKASNVIFMSHCPQANEANCGIAYRSM